MSVSQSDVLSLYLAYFGRPPDPGGLDYYVSNPAFDIWGVAAAFSASPESQSLYGTFGAAQINSIYQNLFNRDAEPDGLAYWTNEVASGRLTPAGAAFAILLGAQNDDKIAVANKLQICSDFMWQLDTQAEQQGYSGDTAAARARAFVHTVDATTASLSVAEAFLGQQVSFATGLTTLTFAATKSASNIVSLTNAGSSVAVVESSGTFTFTSTHGVEGTAQVSGPVAGISVPRGTTLEIASAAAGSKVFSGFGTTVVIADAAGEDLSAMTATGIDAIELTSGKNYTLTAEQMSVARLGELGAIGDITDTGKMTVIGELTSVSGTAAAALRAAGADVVVGLVATGGSITTASIEGVDRIDLASGQDYTVSPAEAAIIGLAPGTQKVTIASAAHGVTLAAAVETFQLSDGINEVTMGDAAQVVLGGSRVDTVTAITGVTSTSDLKAGANVVIVADGADISKGTFNATGGTVEYLVDDAATATMKTGQVDLISSAEGDQVITLGNAATAYTLRSDIEGFVLGNFTNSVTMSAIDQTVTGGSGADTLTAITGVTSTNDLMAGANVVVVGNGADLSKGTFQSTGGTLSFTLSGATTAKLTSAQAAQIGLGAGTQTVTISNAATALPLAASIENFVLGNFTNSVTLGAAAQNVTGGTGVDNVDTADVIATGTLNGGTGTTDKLTVGGTLGAATISNFEILHIDADADISAANAGAALGTTTLTMSSGESLTMTIAQNEGLKTSATVSGSGQVVTLSDAGSTTAIAGVETYVLAAGANTIAVTTAGQAINGAALADGDVLTLTGSVAATVSLVAGDLDASGYTGALTVVATTGTNDISTGSGADKITGGAGDDTITVGGGADIVVLTSLTGVDTVTDFSAAADKFQLSKAVFTGLGSVGNLAASAFESGAGLAAAATAAGRIVYDTTSGDVWYDSDGTGGAAAVHIATLTGVPGVNQANFVIIS